MTYLNDIASNANFGNSGLASIPGLARTAGINGSWVDMLQGDGLCSLILESSIVDGTLGVTIQQSADGNTSLGNITPTSLLGNITSITASSGNGTISVAGFTRDYRYLRANSTFSGNGTWTAIFIEQQKMETASSAP